MGLRVVQLTYNLRNLIGDGCTERYKTGLTYFGIEVVKRLNELNMMIDVSHCSQQVGWDALEFSSSPVIVTHSASNGVCYHDRGKDDDLAKAIADKGGFFGVAAIGAFVFEEPGATIQHFVDHVEHLVDVMGIDHVGIGSDKCGPGPGTESNIIFPAEYGSSAYAYMYEDNPDPRSVPDGFNWSGFRPEHRLTDQHRPGGIRPVHRLAQHNRCHGGPRLQRRRAAQAAGPQLPASLPRGCRIAGSVSFRRARQPASIRRRRSGMSSTQRGK